MKTNRNKYHYLIQEALSLCDHCPIINECLEWAIENERWGIWGGTLPGERVLIRAQRQMLPYALMAHN